MGINTAVLMVSVKGQTLRALRTSNQMLQKAGGSEELCAGNRYVRTNGLTEHSVGQIRWC